jgi:hypothetical protein
MRTVPTAIDISTTRQTKTSRLNGRLTDSTSFMRAPTYYGENSSSLEAARKAAIRISPALARSPNLATIAVTSVSLSGEHDSDPVTGLHLPALRIGFFY